VRYSSLTVAHPPLRPPSAGRSSTEESAMETVCMLYPDSPDVKAYLALSEVEDPAAEIWRARSAPSGREMAPMELAGDVEVDSVGQGRDDGSCH
jgi:hypothetical protein